MDTVPLDDGGGTNAPPQQKKEISALCDILGMKDPSPYYWEEEDVAPPPPPGKKLRHNLFWGCEKIVDGMEFLGEIVARSLGITDSKYQYVIDALEFEKWKEDQEKADLAQLEEYERKQEAAREEKAADALEGGGGGGSGGGEVEMRTPAAAI
ncbi:unnamed protein product [Heterosigma akashiwo]|mmetsp:Transcript_552/g.639  ORF Transcript_552/g.639 Transcript_552/m.639 type:complete len:153 (+) Transcript_552:103-561(+)